MTASLECTRTTCRTPQHACPRCPCPHADQVFDRSICPEPCGVMHTYCLDCGEALETCVWDSTEVDSEDID